MRELVEALVLYLELQRVREMRGIVQNFDRGHIDGGHESRCWCLLGAALRLPGQLQQVCCAA